MIIQIAIGIEKGVTKFSPKKATKIDLRIKGFEFAYHKIEFGEWHEYLITELSTGRSIADALTLKEAKEKAIERVTNPANNFKARVEKILKSR